MSLICGNELKEDNPNGWPFHVTWRVAHARGISESASRYTEGHNGGQ